MKIKIDIEGEFEDLEEAGQAVDDVATDVRYGRVSLSQTAENSPKVSIIIDHDTRASGEVNVSANELFPAQRKRTDGLEHGFNRSDLCRAVEIWFHANDERDGDKVLTVGVAAAAFNVSSEFLASALDEQRNLYFYANEADCASNRVLDYDGE